MNENTNTVRYYVGDTSELIHMIREEAEEATYEFRFQAEDAVEELIDDVYGTVTVAGMEYTTSEILKATDPIAWRCILVDEVNEVDLSDYPSEDLDED